MSRRAVGNDKTCALSIVLGRLFHHRLAAEETCVKDKEIIRLRA